MKKLIILLFSLIAFSSFGKHFILATNANWQFDGVANNVQPGDTIFLAAGARGSTAFQNIHGTKEKPVIIMNYQGVVTITLATTVSGCMSFDNCSFFRITGSGGGGTTTDECGGIVNTNVFYGIILTGSDMAISFRYLSTDFEADHIKIVQAGYAGFNVKTDPNLSKPETLFGAYTMRNPYLHHNWVSTINGEGFYVGNSHMNLPDKKEHEVVGARIMNNITNSTGSDGIQVYSRDAVVSGNSVYNAGSKNVETQNSGIELQPGFIGEVSNNYVYNTGGWAIFAGGSGKSVCKNNLIVKAGGGIIVQTYLPFQSTGWLIKNNSILGIKGEGLYVFTLYPSVGLDNVIQAPTPVRLNGGAVWTRQAQLLFLNE